MKYLHTLINLEKKTQHYSLENKKLHKLPNTKKNSKPKATKKNLIFLISNLNLLLQLTLPRIFHKVFSELSKALCINNHKINSLTLSETTKPDAQPHQDNTKSLFFLHLCLLLRSSPSRFRVYSFWTSKCIKSDSFTFYRLRVV